MVGEPLEYVAWVQAARPALVRFATLDVSEVSARAIVSRALKHLRQHLQEADHA